MFDNDEVLPGISSEEFLRRFTIAIELENKKKKAKRVPIAVFDPNTRKSYLEYSDGTRDYV